MRTARDVRTVRVMTQFSDSTYSGPDSGPSWLALLYVAIVLTLAAVSAGWLAGG
jgi:hypothetical protein